MKNPKILITGGAGYIGSVLSEKLLSLDYSVTVLDTQMYSKTSLVPCVRYGDKFNFIRGDVRDEIQLKKLVDNHDILIPLAALVGAPLSPALRIFSPLPALIRARFLWIFA